VPAFGCREQGNLAPVRGIDIAACSLSATRGAILLSFEPIRCTGYGKTVDQGEPDTFPWCQLPTSKLVGFRAVSCDFRPGNTTRGTLPSRSAGLGSNRYPHRFSRERPPPEASHPGHTVVTPVPGGSQFDRNLRRVGIWSECRTHPCLVAYRPGFRGHTVSFPAYCLARETEPESTQTTRHRGNAEACDPEHRVVDALAVRPLVSRRTLSGDCVSSFFNRVRRVLVNLLDILNPLEEALIRRILRRVLGWNSPCHTVVRDSLPPGCHRCPVSRAVPRGFSGGAKNTHARPYQTLHVQSGSCVRARFGISDPI
jgi:hypothetical protein